jgi:hypothetical protein
MFKLTKILVRYGVLMAVTNDDVKWLPCSHVDVYYCLNLEDSELLIETD